MTNSVHISHSRGGCRERSRRGPFGEPLRATGTAADKCAIRTSSEYWDAETELYYYGMRTYSPRLGRWLTRDSTQCKIFMRMETTAGINGQIFGAYITNFRLRQHLGLLGDIQI